MKRLLPVVGLGLCASLSASAFAQQNATIRWMTGNTAQSVQFANEVAQRYMDANPHTIGGEEYNVTVEIIQGPESATDRYALYLQFFQAQSGEADVLEIDVIWPGDLAEHLVDLYEYEGAREAAEEHFPAIIENNTVDGRLVGMPAFTDAGLLYYRSDLLEEYGFDGPPETWAELEEMARTIMEGERADNPDFTGFVWQGEAYEGLTCNALEWIASFGGGTIVSQEGQIEVFNDQAIAALETAAGWVGTISPQAVTGFQEEDARRIFTAGNAVFMRNWPYAYSLLIDAEGPVTTENVGVTTLPAGEEGGTPAATLGGWQMGVSRYSSNIDVAVDFALFATSYEEQLQRALVVNNLPTIEAIYEDERLLNSPVAWFADLLPVFQSAVARPSTPTAPRYNEVSRAFFTAVHGVLMGTTDAETALGELEFTLEELTGLPVAGGAQDVASR
ncbi:ABC transporter substrate-binding protein [Truepera radiovictrix]|uniref:Extracellular solute-binding protein family 1 n=1 Tax=Truepera radiovictrix (strain DSM 17093 / CIP 108686 / LMG 22925 / RQ-24) TaxID=649638 RepID=D7CSY7_TRURR|nr:ABC transporter substrate-binding protein [Truepera radiovictrix]ADI13754.1 extracellular solute-binding protein family 1 [Truepera radiovictrix DSM 17093]WMT57681.1 ABC transporter substrate-binding protein [Truepera radiovictrix]